MPDTKTQKQPAVGWASAHHSHHFPRTTTLTQQYRHDLQLLPHKRKSGLMPDTQTQKQPAVGWASAHHQHHFPHR